MAVDETFWEKNQEITWLKQLQCISIEDVYSESTNSFTKGFFFHINSPGCQKVCEILSSSQGT